MTDTDTTDTTPAAAEPKTAKYTPHPCICASFRLVDPTDVDENGGDPQEFDTDCKATTMRTFAQGHDARLASFLARGEADGLRIEAIQGGVRYFYDNAEHAAGSISEALGKKTWSAAARLKQVSEAREATRAEKTAAREAKTAEKAEAKRLREADKQVRAALKASQTPAPREVAAQVVEGSQSGDAATAGFVRIKVGRGEYDAIASEVDNGDGTNKLVYSFRNLRGEEEVRDADLVRVLS